MVQKLLVEKSIVVSYNPGVMKLQLAWHGGFREWVLLPKTERHPG